MKNFNAKGIVISLAVMVAGLLLFTMLFNEESDHDPASDPEDTVSMYFARYGYTKGPDNYRLMVYWYAHESLWDDKMVRANLRRHAKNRMHTPGRTTTIYYYEGEHPPERTFRTTEQHRRFLDQYAAPAAVFMIMQDGSLQAL